MKGKDESKSRSKSPKSNQGEKSTKVPSKSQKSKVNQPLKK